MNVSGNNIGALTTASGISACIEQKILDIGVKKGKDMPVNEAIEILSKIKEVAKKIISAVSGNVGALTAESEISIFVSKRIFELETKKGTVIPKIEVTEILYGIKGTTNRIARIANAGTYSK